MIKLDRSLVRIPDSLDPAEGDGKEETNAAINFYTDTTSRKNKTFTFKVYRTKKVKEAVCKLSHNKCAYCESPVMAVDDGDIEHFRPKAEVSIDGGKKKTLGYFWLGATWDNLYLSCKHCNQSRKHPLPDGTIKTQGKKNQFPLSDESKRLKSSTANVKNEEPYRQLIDPCIDDPLNYLEFREDGMVFPKLPTPGTTNPSGEVSINVYALLRMRLVEARQEKALQLTAALKTLEDHVNFFNDNIEVLPDSKLQKLKANINNEIQRVLEYSKTTKAYSGMCIQIIHSFMKNMGLNLPDF